MKNTAILLISCPDRKGIVSEVANFLYENNANILHADEHQDNQTSLFFLRVEWELKDFILNKIDFIKNFEPVAKRFKMIWEIKYSVDKINTAIFLSKEDHCLSDLLYRYKSGELNCRIKIVIGNHPAGSDIAKFYEVPFFQIPSTSDIRKDEKEIFLHLKRENIELLILARYMKILSEDFINKFSNPIINIHHSFLPSFIGNKPYHQAYQRGVKIIGATAHYVTKDLDQGPIIEQDVQRVSHRDGIDDLIQKGRDIEKIVLSRAVKSHLENRVLTYGNKTVVFD